MSGQDILTAKSPAINFSDPKTYHDRVLVVEGKKFYVQSGLLVSWSDYFKTLFEGNFKEASMTEIEIKEINSEDFNNFLKLIYPGKFEINVDNYIGLLQLADRFLSPGVFELIKFFLAQKKSSLDYMKLLKFAFEHDKKELKELCAAHIGGIYQTSIQMRTCSNCQLKPDWNPDCKHGGYAKDWIHDNIDHICELPSEMQTFILRASAGKF